MKRNGKTRRASAKRAIALMRGIDAAVDGALGSDETAARVRRYVAEHDAPADDAAAFGRLCLVIFAQGLHWPAVEAKRAALTTAFYGFEPAVVAGFDDAKIAQVLTQPIIRNEAKVRVCVDNARQWRALANGSGSFLARLAALASDDDATEGWPALAASLSRDFARIGETAARQTLTRWGFFTAFSHPGARRGLERLGGVDAGAAPAAAQIAIGAIAAQLGRDAYAVEALLALFAGLGPCRVQPQCGECPLSDRCPAALVAAPAVS
jgi:3-methyladenine DNA glycosylase Tag